MTQVPNLSMLPSLVKERNDLTVKEAKLVFCEENGQHLLVMPLFYGSWSMIGTLWVF